VWVCMGALPGGFQGLGGPSPRDAAGSGLKLGLMFLLGHRDRVRDRVRVKVNVSA